jgi:phosphatidylethanolamine-binding protein (PEBP) family uncharacterized protein
MVLPILGKVLHPVRAGENRSRLRGNGLDATAALSVTSSTFADGAALPPKCTGAHGGQNVSPALQWTGQPISTKQLVLVVEDIDVPLPRPLLHCIALIEPSIDGLAEGALRSDTPGIRFIPTALGRDGYVGPRPISGHGPHRYRFHLMALSESIPAAAATGRSLFKAAAGRVVARGLITGSYKSR